MRRSRKVHVSMHKFKFSLVVFDMCYRDVISPYYGV